MQQEQHWHLHLVEQQNIDNKLSIIMQYNITKTNTTENIVITVLLTWSYILLIGSETFSLSLFTGSFIFSIISEAVVKASDMRLFPGQLISSSSVISQPRKL